MGRGHIIWMMEKNDWYHTWVEMEDPRMTSAIEGAYQEEAPEIWLPNKDGKFRIHFDFVKMQQFSYWADTMKFHRARPIRRVFVYSGMEVKNAVGHKVVCDNSIISSDAVPRSV